MRTHGSHVRRPRGAVVAALCSLWIPLVAACAGPGYRTALEMPSGYRAEVLALGDRPKVHVENQGPGHLRIDAEGAEGGVRESTVLAIGAITVSFAGPIRLVLVETGHGPTRVLLRIEGCKGVAIDAAAPPARPE